jgi:drug/metabolite transporter (DMT)-like permease
MVFICGRRRRSLRVPSNFHPPRRGTHRRRPWWIRGRGECGLVDFALSRIPAVRWTVESKFSMSGFNYSLLTGICVGAGTIAFFLLFQKGGPLSAVPAILAGGIAIMAIAGILFFHETASWQRVAGVVFAIVGLFLLRK